MPAIRHVFFDNDGTIVDTEILAIRAMLDLLRPLGFTMGQAEYSHRFPGLLERQILEIVQKEHGIAIPDDFLGVLHTTFSQYFETGLQPVPGMPDLFRRIRTPKSMVSNASAEHVERCMRQLELWHDFEGRIFSANHVERPKPHPDVYLHALETVGLAPGQAIAIEDSETGVAAAKAAGLRVAGLLAASHIGDGHADRLWARGADFVAADAGELAGWLARFELV